MKKRAKVGIHAAGRKRSRKKPVRNPANHMAGRKEAEILVRRAKVAALYLRRLTEAQIAAQLGVSQQTISGDVIALKAGWKEDARESTEAARARELAELEDMERQADEEFQKEGEDGGKNPRWMQLRLTIKERRAKLLGLDNEDGGGPRHKAILTKGNLDLV